MHMAKTGLQNFEKRLLVSVIIISLSVAGCLGPSSPVSPVSGNMNDTVVVNQTATGTNPAVENKTASEVDRASIPAVQPNPVIQPVPPENSAETIVNPATQNQTEVKSGNTTPIDFIGKSNKSIMSSIVWDVRGEESQEVRYRDPRRQFCLISNQTSETQNGSTIERAKISYYAMRSNYPMEWACGDEIFDANLGDVMADPSVYDGAFAISCTYKSGQHGKSGMVFIANYRCGYISADYP